MGLYLSGHVSTPAHLAGDLALPFRLTGHVPENGAAIVDGTFKPTLVLEGTISAPRIVSATAAGLRIALAVSGAVSVGVTVNGTLVLGAPPAAPPFPS